MMDEETKKAADDKREEKIQNFKVIKQLDPDSKYSAVQQLAQEAESIFIIEGKRPTDNKVRDALIDLIKDKYRDDPEMEKQMLDAVPTRQAINKWRRKEDWEDHVWKSIRDTGLFSHNKRAAIINELFKQAQQGNTSAAKLWLTMSGDYTEKLETKGDETVSKFREINKILQKKEE